MRTQITLLWILICGITFGQSHTEKLTREFSFEQVSQSNTMIIANINGSVSVTGYTGSKIVVEIEKTIKAKTEQRLEKGKRELTIGVIDRADTIILYLNGLCNTFGQGKKNNWNRKRNAGWGYDWNGCDDDENWRDNEGYDFKVNFTVKVPQGVNVHVSTVNDGDIDVENIQRTVVADNINGSIRLKNIAGATHANTINGDVDISYTKNPDQDCRYYSLNGDINAHFKKGLSANLSFESFNGDLYTNVAKLESLPVHVQKDTKSDRTRYKLSGNRFKIGAGGIHLDFETFNGNAYVKELEN